jgi:hypothetical protein
MGVEQIFPRRSISYSKYMIPCHDQIFVLAFYTAYFTNKCKGEDELNKNRQAFFWPLSKKKKKRHWFWQKKCHCSQAPLAADSRLWLHMDQKPG